MKPLLFISLWLAFGAAQAGEAQANPEVRNVIIEEGAVTTVRLSPGYTTSVRLPEEVSSVVVGNPLTFKAEHSESEARLVFFKPITVKPAIDEERVFDLRKPAQLKSNIFSLI
jgi:type IV secretory pathway VirB9-like protein